MARKTPDVKQVAWRTFLAAHALLVRRMDGDLAAAGVLPMESYDVLLILHDAPGRRLRLSELADRALLTRSGVTRLVDRLEGAGLLCRQDCPSDRRGSFARLTDRGESELKRTGAVYARSVESHFGEHLTDGEAVALNTALGRALSAERGPEVVPLNASGRIGKSD